jgi:hypothetical protein
MNLCGRRNTSATNEEKIETIKSTSIHHTRNRVRGWFEVYLLSVSNSVDDRTVNSEMEGTTKEKAVA